MNRQMMLGTIGVSVLILAALFAPRIAPYDIDFQENFIVVETDAGVETLFSPHPPSGRHPFGTDPFGYDLLTQILHGLRYTLLTALSAAFLRLLIGGAIGIPRGTIHGWKRQSILIKGLIGIPPFLMIYFLLFRVTFNPPISRMNLILLEIALLTLFGIPGVSDSLRARCASLAEREFIEAARSCGAGNARIIFRHILPHLWEDLVLKFLTETLLVLSLMGQLAIFYIFIGSTIYTTDPPLFFSSTHEIAGMVGQYRNYINNSRWLILFPLLTYLFILGSLSLLSRGMNRAFSKKLGLVRHI